MKFQKTVDVWQAGVQEQLLNGTLKLSERPMGNVWCQ